MLRSLVGSEMCIRDSINAEYGGGGVQNMRVLCLHGYAQSGAALRSKSGALRSETKKLGAEYVFLDAPHLLSAQHLQARRVATGRVSTENEPRSLEGDPPRSWYMVEEDGRYQEDSIAASMAAVERCCLESGPFDGVLGFSQGASMAALVACLLYTSDAADEEDSVDLGGRRIIKKKIKNRHRPSDTVECLSVYKA
eukprot:TRINITY_DN3601_c0_g1_i2.p1 TRINITY_DN3601_c0_g1~~TRINITY_DN3601_c0_g1_i2.p1  ORF type:complete len:196 (-),score=53.60 TRINITY_DN3601_c0_g1_i2:51-638(-)